MNYVIRAVMAAILLLLLSSCEPRDRYVTVTGFAQGGTYTVKFNMNGTCGKIRATPREVKDSIDNILGNIDRSLSGYNRNSLLSRFNEAETVTPDKYFMDMYDHAYRFYELTSGVVDAASAPLFDVWGFGFRNGQMPDDDAVEKARKISGMCRLQRSMGPLLSADGTISSEVLLLDKTGGLPKLNYNALAQGYSCDVVAEYLYSIGVKDMMVDIGEIFCDGKNPSGKSWTIGIDRPVDGNNVPGADIQGIFRVPEGFHGIVTSGNYRKYYIKDGRKYAHTIDPRSGTPVSHNLLSATIVAADALTADAYATYCMAIGLEESVSFLEASPELEGCLVYDDGGVFRTWTSKGFVLE